MITWTSDELDKIGTAEELEIASLGTDGTLTKPVTIWVVRDGDVFTSDPSTGGPPPGSVALRCAAKDTSMPAALRRTSRS